MYIIASKSSSETIANFVEDSKTDSTIDGIHIDVVMTRDGKVVYYTQVGITQNDINTVQNEDLKELKLLQFIELEELLNTCCELSKKVIINMYNVYDLVDKTVEEITDRNKEYVLNVLNVVKNHPELELYIETDNNAILSLLRTLGRTYKIGFVVNPNNLSFQEADYYSLRPNMININVINELLERNREVMINFTGWNPSALEITKTRDLIQELNSPKTNNMYYITEYPSQFYNNFIN